MIQTLIHNAKLLAKCVELVHLHNEAAVIADLSKRYGRPVATSVVWYAMDSHNSRIDRAA